MPHHQSSTKRVKITHLQMKGIFTLTLFFLADTRGVAAVAAANSGGANQKAQKCSAASSSFWGSSSENNVLCENVPTNKQQRPQPFWNRFQPARRIADCTRDCAHCLDIPRGGHGVHGVAEAAATAVSTSTPYGIPLNMWKVIFQALLTTINVVCWLVPLRSKRISENKLALSLANAFSGGVFLSLAFTHLIPECTHGFGPEWPEAAPFALILVGYLLIFFVEKVAFDAHDILHEMQEGGHSHSSKNNKVMNGQQSTNSEASHTGRSAVILLGALGVHSVLEMMALGLSDSFGDSALLTMSIALHQPAESIALLVAFLKSGMPKGEIIRFLSIFSCMGPLGVALGMAVNEYAAPIVDSIFLAIVAGTFVYVGATEVIPEEWEDSEYKWTKFGALMAGIVGIIGITQYTASLGGH